VSRVLGIDFGTKRAGLAISDGIGLTARPLEVVESKSLMKRLRGIVDEYDIGLIVVGLPTGLSGNEGESAIGARRLGEQIAAELALDVEYVDERFTSRIAEGALLESGMKRRGRKETVDKVAAAIILQSYLDRQGRDGNPPPGPGVENPGST
jgi:putative Holliday junction resolvase